MKILKSFNYTNKKALLFTVVISLISTFSFSKTFTTTSSGSWTSATWSCTGGCSSATEAPGSNFQGHTVIVNHNISSGFPDNITFNSGTTNLEINGTIDDLSSTSISVSNGGTIFNLEVNVSSELNKISNSAELNIVVNAPLIISGNLEESNDGETTITSSDATPIDNTVQVSSLLVSGGVFLSDVDIDVMDDLIVTNANTSFTMNGDLSVADLIRVQDSQDVVFNGDIEGKDFAEINASAVVTINGDAVFTGDFKLTDKGKLLGSGSLEFLTFEFTNFSVIDGDGACGIDGDDITTSPFFIDLTTCGNSPLPIELNYFSVIKTIEGFQYNWETFTEIDNDYFVIEYSSNLKSFTELAFVSGAGTSFKSQEYEYFSDDLFVNPSDDVIYFRLKQVDFDGEFTYSNVVAVTLNIENVLVSMFELYPNPAKDVVKIQLPSNVLHDEVVDVTMLNVLTNNRSVEEINTINEETVLDISHLSSGLYVVSVEGVSRPVKLVIQ